MSWRLENADSVPLPVMLSAAANGDLQTLKHLCSVGQSVEQVDCLGRTALMLAARYAQLQIVEYLIHEKNANVLHRDDNGNSAVDWTIKTGYEFDKLEIRRRIAEMLNQEMAKAGEIDVVMPEKLFAQDKALSSVDEEKEILDRPNAGAEDVALDKEFESHEVRWRHLGPEVYGLQCPPVIPVANCCCAHTPRSFKG